MNGVDPSAATLAEIRHEFVRLRLLAEGAMTQVVASDEARFFHVPAGGSNSIAILVKHMGGNLRSRWTDFLATDGEKPWRERDREFVLEAADTREALRAGWDAGWETLLATLDALQPGDLLRTVHIRSEPHTVIQALVRGLGHASYHVGQIVLLCRVSTGASWSWLSVPPGKSAEFLRDMQEKHRP